MEQAFADEAGRRLVREIADSFRGARIFRRSDRRILFVCGGPIDDAASTMRRRFLDWARTELPEFLVILAETAFKDTLLNGPTEPPNLSRFETAIAETADSVLLFLESYGSFAEAGVFSTEKKISSKTLVVNEAQFQAKDSFTNLGPVATIDARSVFRPTLWIEFGAPNADFSQVRERLQSRLPTRKHRKGVPQLPFNKHNYADKLALVLELVRVFRAVTFVGLTEGIRLAFQSSSTKDLRRLLSILVGARCITRTDDYFVLEREAANLLEFDNLNVEDLISKVLHYYRHKHADVYALATGSR